jgi:hypothetical protein
MYTPNGILIAHDDHGLAEEHLKLIDVLLSGWKDDRYYPACLHSGKPGEFAIYHPELPEDCPSLLSGLHGPTCGDEAILEEEVQYMDRENRAGPSRMCARGLRPCRQMVVIVGKDDFGDPVVYTAYGSQTVAPREWWDRSLVTLAETLESAQFWETHALALTMLSSTEDKSMSVKPEDVDLDSGRYE